MRVAECVSKWALMSVICAVWGLGCSVELSVPETCVGENCGQAQETNTGGEDVGNDTPDDIEEDTASDTGEDTSPDVEEDPITDPEDDTSDASDVTDQDTELDVPDEDASTAPTPLAAVWSWPPFGEGVPSSPEDVVVVTHSRQLTAAVNVTTDTLSNVRLAAFVEWADVQAGDSAAFTAHTLRLAQMNSEIEGDVSLYADTPVEDRLFFSGAFEAPSMRKDTEQDCFITGSYRELDDGEKTPLLWYGPGPGEPTNGIFQNVCFFEENRQESRLMIDETLGDVFVSPALHRLGNRIAGGVAGNENVLIARFEEANGDYDRKGTDDSDFCGKNSLSRLHSLVKEEGEDGRLKGLLVCQNDEGEDTVIHFDSKDDNGLGMHDVTAAGTSLFRPVRALSPGISLPASGETPSVYAQLFQVVDDAGAAVLKPHVLLYNPFTGTQVGAIEVGTDSAPVSWCSSQSTEDIPFERDGLAFANLETASDGDGVNTELLVTLRTDASSGCQSDASDLCACTNGLESHVFAFDLAYDNNVWSSSLLWQSDPVAAYLVGPLVGDMDQDGTQEIVYSALDSLSPRRQGGSTMLFLHGEDGQKDDRWMLDTPAFDRTVECDTSDSFIELPVAFLNESPARLLTLQLFKQVDPCDGSELVEKEGGRLHLYEIPSAGSVQDINVQWSQRLSSGSYDGLYNSLESN